MMDMTVKELSRVTDVTADAIRYYARIGLLHPERNESNGYRRFARTDVIRLKFIQRAKTLGYKLDEIREILAASEHGDSPCPLARELIARRIKENRKALDEALILQKRMENAMAQWRELPDGVPVGDSICILIEQATAGM